MAYVLAVGAALANAITTILQRIGVETAPQSAVDATEPDHPRDPQAGLGVSDGRLDGRARSGCRPPLSPTGVCRSSSRCSPSSCRFSFSSSSFWFGQRIGWHEVVGAIAAAGGLAAFLTFANPHGGDEVPNVGQLGHRSDRRDRSIAISVGLARRGTRPAWRAAWFGTSAAISYAFTAAFAKEVTEQIGVQVVQPVSAAGRYGAWRWRGCSGSSSPRTRSTPGRSRRRSRPS